MQFWLHFPKSIFTERRKTFSSRSHFEAFFWNKNVKIYSGQLECILDNPLQSFRPMLCEFYRPAKQFSTTIERFPPNVGRRKEKYDLFGSDNDPRIVTLDTFTAIWTSSSSFKGFHNTATFALKINCLQHCRERLDEVEFCSLNVW